MGEREIQVMQMGDREMHVSNRERNAVSFFVSIGRITVRALGDFRWFLEELKIETEPTRGFRECIGTC